MSQKRRGRGSNVHRLLVVIVASSLVAAAWDGTDQEASSTSTSTPTPPSPSVLESIVATPVYCVSRFCGPIADRVCSSLRASTTTWPSSTSRCGKDFEADHQQGHCGVDLARSGRRPAEPWVFLVNADGIIVATEASRRAAVVDVLEEA